MTRIDSELEQLASLCGIMTSYEDVFQKRHVASRESLLAVLNAMGVDVPTIDDVRLALAQQRLERLQRGLEPVVVVWHGDPVAFDLTVPWQARNKRLECTLQLEDGTDKFRRHFNLSEIDPLASSCGQFATLRMKIPLDLADGYYRLIVQVAGHTCESLVIAAPRVCGRREHPPGLGMLFAALCLDERSELGSR